MVRSRDPYKSYTKVVKVSDETYQRLMVLAGDENIPIADVIERLLILEMHRREQAKKSIVEHHG